MDSNNLENNKEIVQQTINSMVKSLGIHVVTIVFEHALWKTKHKFAEAELLSLSEDTVCFDLLDKTETETANMVLRELLVSIVDSLSSLVGKQIATKLVSELYGEGEILE